MPMLKPLGWQPSLIHPPLGQQAVLGGMMPLGTTSETIAQTFPVLQLALEQGESNSESDQSVEWLDWNWDNSSEPNDTALSSSSATSEPPSQPAPSAEFSTLQASSITEPQAQSLTDASNNLSQDSQDQSSAAKFELLHPQITRKPLGVDSPLGYREPLEPIEPTVETDFSFYTTEPTAPAKSSIQRSYEESTFPTLSSPALSPETPESSATESEAEVETEPEITEPSAGATEGILSYSDRELAQPERSISRSEAETESVDAQSSNRPVLPETDGQFSPDSPTISAHPNQKLGDFSTLSRSIEETAISTSSTTASETDQPSNQAASAENSDLADLSRLGEPSTITPDSPSLFTVEPTSFVTTDSTTSSDITTDSTVPPDSFIVSSTETSTPTTKQPALTDSVDSTQVATPVESPETDGKASIQLAAESIVDRANEPTSELASESTVPTESNSDLNLRIDPTLASVDEYATRSRPDSDNRSFTLSDSPLDSSDEIPGADLETRSLPGTAPESTSELASESIDPVQDEALAQLPSSERVDQPSIQLAGKSVDEQITESTSEQSAGSASEAIRSTEMNSASDAGVDAAVSSTDEYSNQAINASETVTPSLASIQTNNSASLHQIQPAPIENDSISENRLTFDATSPTAQIESNESQTSSLPQPASGELQHSPIEEAQLQSIETTASGQTPDQAKASLPNESLSQTHSIQAKLDPDAPEIDAPEIDAPEIDAPEIDAPEILDPQSRVDQVPTDQANQANEQASVGESDSESANLQTSIATNGHQPILEPVNPQTDIPETSQASQNIVQFDRNHHQTDASIQSAQSVPDSWSSLSELIAADSAQSAPWQETLDSLNAIAQPYTQPDSRSEASPLEPQDRADADEQTVIQTRSDSSTAAISSDASPDSKPDFKPAPQPPTDEQLDQLAIIIYSQLRRQFEIDRERQGQFLSGHSLWLGEVIVAERAGAKSPGSSTQKLRKNEIEMILPNAALDRLTAEIHALLKRQIELDRERNSLYF